MFGRGRSKLHIKITEYYSSLEERNAKVRSNAIDKQLVEERRERRHETQVLLLGMSGSGKSTVMNQLGSIYHPQYTNEELMAWRLAVYRNVVESTHYLVCTMKQLELECILPENRAHVEDVLGFQLSPESTCPFPEGMSQKIYDLWQDPITPQLIDADPCILSKASYFLSQAPRIGAPDYIPTATDLLYTQSKTTGLVEIKLKIGYMPIRLIDMGTQRIGRQKWFHCFQHLTGIIFCTDLSDYDKKSLGTSGQNRLVESISLFDSIINSRWFLRTSIILFMNKMDIFKVKFPKVPLEEHFPEYTGGNDINKALKYILRMFVLTNRPRTTIYPHLTQATNITNMRLISFTVRDILLPPLRDPELL